MLFDSWRESEKEWRYKVNPIAYIFFWARSKYQWIKRNITVWYYKQYCKYGHHITYDTATSYKQVQLNGKMRTLLVLSYRRPITHCRRCGQEVNKGIETFYSGRNTGTSYTREG